ncbi:ion transporter [Pedobacter sp. SAFR-022]|uniref:ion transporter n=1 Tax=Pedobacter sp. SAFR-022 TaxID=3436861 RepID=UPI003F8150E0
MKEIPERNHDLLRKKIYIIIFRSDTPAGRLFDLSLLFLILLSIFSVALESVATFRRDYLTYIHIIEWTCTIFFTIEYALRIYVINRPKQYIFSFYGLVDLVAFLPTYLSFFLAGTQFLVVVRAFRLLRVFRILKLSRFLSEGNILKQALQNSMHKIVVFLATVLTLVIIMGTIMYLIEGPHNGFENIPISIYWAIVTITTVGYGDVSPQSPLGQFFASILMIMGYGIIAVPTGIVSVEMAKATELAKKRCPACRAAIVDSEANFCSNCGVDLKQIQTNAEAQKLQ